MRFHWYWPFARQEELALAMATARAGDSVAVQVIDRSEAPTAGKHGAVTVIRNLPDVDRTESSGIRWLYSRQRTYRARTRARRDMWAENHFDLIHLHYLNRFTDAFVSLPHPLVMSVHDVVPHVMRLGARAEHQLLSRLYGRADALVVHHPGLVDRLAHEFRIPADRVHVVPHQVFPVGRVDEQPPEGPPMVLFFGALRPNKGIELLGDVVAQLGIDDLRFVIAGRGDASLERAVTDLAAHDPRVTAEIGFATLERKRELFNAASVVILPYTSFASQSGVLHDAYGHGRPVVVTDVGVLGDSVREDGTGIVVPPGDVPAITEAIRAALVQSTWTKHAAAARRVATERSPGAVGARLRAVYDDVIRDET
jgi:glycosyltransferase involved in cell wall biosynthesis